MIQQVLGDSNLSVFAVIGLVLFVAIFVAISVWILTRSKRQVRTWSELPLAGDREAPSEPRPSSSPSQSDTELAQRKS
jgi:hypothetical protein